MTGARPVHRQFGSKTRVAGELLGMMPPNCRVWVEVFAGTAALTLAKAPHSVEHVNDLNGQVVNLFRVLRNPAARARLCEAVALTPWSQEEYAACMRQPHIDDAVERARRFLVVSWQGMGGKQVNFSGWRFQRTEPWVIGTWAGVPSRIVAAAERLLTVHVHQRDCRDMVRTFADLDNAVLFLDPPYPLELTNTPRQEVYSVRMSRADHAELAEQLLGVRAKVILTMAEGSIYDAALEGWYRRPLTVRGLRNTRKTERVYTNFKPPDMTLFGDGSPLIPDPRPLSS